MLCLQFRKTKKNHPFLTIENYETDPRKNMQIHLDFCGQITFITYSFYNWRPYTLS